MFINIVGGLLTALLAGGGFATTELDVAIPETGFAGTISTLDVTGFLDADIAHPAYIQIDDEIFYYTDDPDPVLNHLTSVTRAQADPQTTLQTIAAAHAIGSHVVSQDIAFIDGFIGYDITSSGATFGAFDSMKLIWKFFTLIPGLIIWDYPWFTGQAALFRYVLLAFSAGFVLSFAMTVVSLASSIFKP